ncbi:hypothetical protein ACEWY4_028057 [Coilia grayii]|uniref:Gag-Pol polyprotein n=1 Tax=Coilia grayii TaxID=363190 RepID=A0ABD1IQT3_9TELE
MPILLSPSTPVNLLGRDALCKLGLKIECTSEGVSVGGPVVHMSLLAQADGEVSRSLSVMRLYWISNFDVCTLEQLWEKWECVINEHNSKLCFSYYPVHCTLKVDPLMDDSVECKWQQEVPVQQNYSLSVKDIVVGPEGVGMFVLLADETLVQHFDIPHTVPHIVLATGKGYRVRHVGDMMMRAFLMTWPFISKGCKLISEDGVLLRISEELELRCTPQIVELADKNVHDNERIDFDMEMNIQECPFKNPYCLYSKFPGVGYSCWKTQWHQPLSVLEMRRLQYDQPYSPWKMMFQAEGRTDYKDKLLRRVPDCVWPTDDSDVGLVKSASPVELRVKPGAILPFHRQYPVSPEAAVGLRGIINNLLKAKVIEPVNRPLANSPIFAIQKADKVNWRLLIDIRSLNQVLEDMPNYIASPTSLLTNVPPSAKYFSVCDLVSAFYTVPLAENSKGLCGFKYLDNYYQYTRLPMGLKISPTVFNQVLKEDLKHLSCTSTLLQYVDDLILCSPDAKTCEKDTLMLLQTLAEGGHKVSRKKLKFVETEVTYLGRAISQEQRGIAQDQIKAITQVPKPQTIKQMMTFIGLVGFSSEWIECHEYKIAPLRAMIAAATAGGLHKSLTWTIDGEQAFTLIKMELQKAPALALPNYELPFHLYVAVKKEEGRDAYMTGMLTQAQCKGKAKQALAYYCSKLDDVAQGYPPCYQGVEAVYMAYVKATGITMGWPITIYTAHAISQLVEQGRFCLTPQRQLKYNDLSFCPDVTIKTCDMATNPADRIPLDYEGTPHECVADSLVFSKLRADLESEPLESGLVFFVDGSSHNYDNKTCAGFSVVQLKEEETFEVVMCIPCKQPCSAQLAELKALTEACLLADSQHATIFTDSAYAHNVCHVHGAHWKQRGFKKSDGSPIQHLDQIQLLLTAMMSPVRLAICKCQAHKKGDDLITRGNALADEIAKDAALKAREFDSPCKQGMMHVLHSTILDGATESGKSSRKVSCPYLCPYAYTNSCRWCKLSNTPGHFHASEPLCCALCQHGSCPECWAYACESTSEVSPRLGVQAPLHVLQPKPSLDDVIRLQQIASLVEKSSWEDKGSTRGPDGVWRNHEGLMVAPLTLIGMLISDVHDVDHESKREVLRKIRAMGFWSPCMNDMVDHVLQRCSICHMHNIRKGIPTNPLAGFPVPEGPFKHVVIDYIDMIKTVKRYRYVLVVVCRFSRWVEACESPEQNEATVIKFFTRELIPRFGIPEIISSDNGKAFTAKTWAKIGQALGIKQKFGCVYHPQSQGIVERANSTLKNKIAKICASTSLNWLDALPIALMHMRTQEHRVTHLTPAEMLFGRPMPTPRIRGNGRGPSLDQLKLEIKHYLEQLLNIHAAIRDQAVTREERRNATNEMPVGVGDWVYIKAIKRAWLEPRAEGPYEVVQATPTAVRVKGSKTWYHLNLCYRAPSPQDKDRPYSVKKPSVRLSSNGEGHSPDATDLQSLPADGGVGSSGQAGGLDQSVRPLSGPYDSSRYVYVPSDSDTTEGLGDTASVDVDKGSEPTGSHHAPASGADMPSLSQRRDEITTEGTEAGPESGSDSQSGGSSESSCPTEHPWTRGVQLDPHLLYNNPESAIPYRYESLTEFTAKTYHPPENCYVCAQARPPMIVIPAPHRHFDAVEYYDQECKKCSPNPTQCRHELPHVRDCLQPLSVSGYECLVGLGTSNFDNVRRTEVRQFAVKRRDLFKSKACEKMSKWPETFPSTIKKYKLGDGFDFDCYLREGKEKVGTFQGRCNITFVIDHPYQLVLPRVSKAESEFRRFRYRYRPYVLPIAMLEHQNVSLADYWWACGPEWGLHNTLPKDWDGLCARVTAMQDSSIVYALETKNASYVSSGNYSTHKNRVARGVKKYEKDPRVYLDAIGQPRGIPAEYKIRSETAAGFEAIIPMIGIGKLWEVANYYNQQRFLNYTVEALESFGEQLDATSRVAMQNRMALDWLLAKDGGVCAMVGLHCCTYIPNNTAANGSFSLAMNRLKSLSVELAENAGRDTKIDQWFDHWITTILGPFSAWFVKVAALIGGILLIVSLVFCCLVPCLRTLFVRIAAGQVRSQMVLSGLADEEEDNDRDEREIPTAPPYVVPDAVLHQVAELPLVVRAQKPQGRGELEWRA